MSTTTSEGKGAKLHEVWPNGFYCGPSVIAAVTGADCRVVRGWINAVRHRRPNQGVLGMQNRELVGTLASRGYALVPLDVPQPAKRWAFGERPIFENFAAGLEAGARYAALGG